MEALYLRLEKLLPDTPENKALLLEVAALEAASHELLEKLSLLGTLEAILDILDKSGELTKPISDHSILFGLNFGGGSAMLHVGNLREMVRAAEKLNACLPKVQ